MPNIKYTATLVPNVVRDGDKVRIKGNLADDPKEFSINFVNEHCSEPAFITYHFKLDLQKNTIIQNYKDNGVWVDHLEEAYDGHDGVLFVTERNKDNSDRSNNDDNYNNYSVLGSSFEFEFTFNDGYIHVYRIFQNTPNHIAMYTPSLDISDIKALQVWGDVAKVTGISFRYPG